MSFSGVSHRQPRDRARRPLRRARGRELRRPRLRAAGASAAARRRRSSRGASGSQREIPQVVVKDTLAALGRLAAAWRGRFTLPVARPHGQQRQDDGEGDARLDPRRALRRARGRARHRGQPQQRHRRARSCCCGCASTIATRVLEMGMNHLGEIDYLARLAAPGVALVNNAHRAHIGLLGTLEADRPGQGRDLRGAAPRRHRARERGRPVRGLLEGARRRARHRDLRARGDGRRARHSSRRGRCGS